MPEKADSSFRIHHAGDGRWEVGYDLNDARGDLSDGGHRRLFGVRVSEQRRSAAEELTGSFGYRVDGQKWRSAVVNGLLR